MKSPPLSHPLIDHLEAIGQALLSSFGKVLDALPEGDQGPQRLAGLVGMDKVFTSRLLKSQRATSPLAALHNVPGPDPLRKFLRAARRRGVDAPTISHAMQAVDAFQSLLREEMGDRSTLDALLSSWLPQARDEFELRRKQAVYKAMSQLKGVSAATNLATVLLHPAEEDSRIDVVWLVGLLGLQRWRPGAKAKLATRRFVKDEVDRRPMTLEGRRVEGLEGLRLDQFCSATPAEFEVRTIDETTHYLLGGEGVGRRATSDLLMAEVNRSEMTRVPEPGRRGYVFAEISTPARTLLFDVLVHADLYPGATPELSVYDTSFDGVVDANDPVRDIDRLDLANSLEFLGRGTERLHSPDVPRHGEILDHVLSTLGWDASALRAYRVRIDYPLYGSQVVIAFEP